MTFRLSLIYELISKVVVQSIRGVVYLCWKMWESIVEKEALVWEREKLQSWSCREIQAQGSEISAK